MLKLLIVVCTTWVLASCQGQSFDYFYDYVDAPPVQQVEQRPLARAPPPPPPPQPRARAPAAPRARPQASRPALQQASPLEDPTATPVPILKDSRRIDTKTGAFVYEYAGADGSEKHEYRFQNGTVIGNYTFINDLGERETRVYSAGVFDPNHVDETTDPNYVDLGNYDLYKHLEQPYVHDDGTPGFDADFRRPPPSPQASAPRPRGKPRRPAAPRPVAPPRAAAPRPLPPPPPPPQQAVAQFPSDFGGAPVFPQPPASASVFDYEDVAIAPLPVAPVPVRGPPAPSRDTSSRGQTRSRPRAPQGPPSRHRLDLSPSGQSPSSILDSLISQFQ